MEMNWRLALVSGVFVMGWLWPMVVMGGPVLHKVGGRDGWKEGVNYTQWSSQQHVYIGDWLLFTFDKRYYNVLEVNKTSYENCIDKDFMKNVTRGGRDVVQLTDARTYYFISSGGYCFHGMRVDVNVEEHQTAAPSPSPSQVSSTTGYVLPSVYPCIIGLLLLMWFG